jgi:iron complex outermembrane receptor protein
MVTVRRSVAMQRFVFVLAAGLSAEPSVWAQKPAGADDLTQVGLEDLMNVKVTSVSKREQELFRAAAAVYVITQEDIRKSGASNIPDVLRMAPGVEVAQIDANAWAISVRGFNSRYSNKVLVLVDGRSVYTPTFSGVYWDHLEVPLEDIDRIEVIRGPGATVWGANAVNGVINIITRSSKATQGGLIEASAGTKNQAGVLRYGGQLGNSATYRAFGRYSRADNSVLADGSEGADGWSRIHGGFRADWQPSSRDSFTVQGDLFANRGSQNRHRWFMPAPYDPPYAENLDSAGGNLLARWNHTLMGGSDTSLSVYYDTYRRVDFGLPEDQKTFNVDFQHHVAVGSRHDIVWGLGGRVLETAVPPGYQVALAPPRRTDQLYSAFLQDEIRVAPSLWLTLGSKLEHNSYTGFEYEPSARLAWAVSSRQTLWAAASRAIRQPSREEVGVDVQLFSYPAAPGITVESRLYGNPRQRSEELRDYEVGYRAQWSKSVSLDLTGFLSFYRHLTTYEPQQLTMLPAPGGVPGGLMIAPELYDNRARSVNYGSEAAINWNVTRRWRVSPSYSFLHINTRLDSGSNDTSAIPLSGNSPRHMFQIRSWLNLSRRVEWGQTLYWAQAFPNGTIPAHTRLDSRLAWRASESTEFSVVGQDLLRPRIMEFGDTFNIVGTQTERSIYGKVTWTF